MLYYNQKEGEKDPDRKEVKIMTKVQMIDYIEQSGMVVNFSRSYFMKKSRADVETYFVKAVRFCNR